MATRFYLFFLLLVCMLAACSPQQPVLQTAQYHAQSKPVQTKKNLNGLQVKALQLMKQSEFEASILYLQRAIKVEPRDPLNWHFLAQNYWQLKDFTRCRSMIHRARSYSQFDEDLNRANDLLLKQCTPGN